MPTTKKPTINQVLNCPNLPTLPTVAVQLLELIRDPDVGINDIKMLVESDTGLAGRVLKTVNSSAFGLRQRCNNIQRALGYMGMNSIKSLVLGFSLVDWTKDVDGDGFDIDNYWKRVIYGAAAARVFALQCKACDPDDVFTGALFQDMGILAMLTMLGDQYTSIATAASDKHDDLPVLEREALGFDHTQAGSALGEKWRLPESIVECVKFHHKPNSASAHNRDLVRLVALGRLAASALCESDYTGAVRELRELAQKWYGIDRNEAVRLIDQASIEGQELSKLFDQNIGSQPDINALLAEAGEQMLEHQMAVARKVSDLEVEKQSLEKSSLTDGLTGAWNRKMFDQMIEEAFENARNNDTAVAVIFMDGDKFKSVNDTYGHSAGDKVIQILAQRMNTAVADHGVVCRYGGEEFAVILENTTTERAVEIAEACRALIADTPFNLAGVEGAPEELPITASLGVSISKPQQDDGSPETVVHEADVGVYASKRNGRNQVTLYTPEVEAAEVAAKNADSGSPTTATGDNDAETDTASPTASTSAPPVPSSAPPIPEIRVAPNAEKTVMIFEDDTLAARLLDAMFRRTPNVQVECLSGMESITGRINELKRDATQRPDLIIVDLGLPGISGVDVIKDIRANAHLASLPIVVLTGCSDAKTIRAARAAGADACYAKQDVSRHIARWTKDVLALTARASAA